MKWDRTSTILEDNLDLLQVERDSIGKALYRMSGIWEEGTPHLPAIIVKIIFSQLTPTLKPMFPIRLGEIVSPYLP